MLNNSIICLKVELYFIRKFKYLDKLKFTAKNN